MVGILLVISAVASASVAGGAAPLPPSASFWDDYVATRRLAQTSPDSACGFARQLLEQDADHFLGSWLEGECLASRGVDPDSAAGVELASPFPLDRAGGQITLATLHLRRRAWPAGRAALDRARDAYAAAGRPLDACRAVLWKVQMVAPVMQDAQLEEDIRQAEALARRIGDPANLADVLLAKARCLDTREPDTALDARREAVRLLSPLGPSAQLASCHRLLAVGLKRIGELERAESHYRVTIELARALGDRVEELRGIAGLGHLATARGSYSSALDLQEQALAIAEQIGSETEARSRLADIGRALIQLGRYREARGCYERALSLTPEAETSSEVTIQIIDGLASVEALSGKFDDARRHWEEAIAASRESNLRSRLPFLLLHLAQLQLDVNDAVQALSTAEEALASAREVRNSRSELLSLSLLANIRRTLAENEAALRVARDAKLLARVIEPRLEWEISRAEASSLHELGRSRTAIALLDSTAKALVVTAPDTMRLALSLELQGRLRLAIGDPASAKPLLLKGLELVRAVDAPGYEAPMMIDLGKVKLASGGAEEAVRLLEKGLGWIEETRSRIAASEDRSGYQSRWYDDYYALAVAEVRCGRAADAFAAMERAKGRELREHFGAPLQMARGTMSAPLAEAIERTERDLAETQWILMAEYRSPERGVAVAALERAADSLKTAWSDLERRREREAGGRGRGTRGKAPVTAAEVLAVLGPGEELLAFMVGSDGILRFHFRARDLRVAEIACSEESIARQVEELTAQLQDPGSELWQSPAANLADVLLGDLWLHDRPPRRLYIVPDGGLHTLAFEVLRPLVSESDPPRALILDLGEVVYAQSATMLLEGGEPGAGSRTIAGTDLVAFGDPEFNAGGASGAGSRPELASIARLPHAQVEVERIGGLYPQAKVFVGEEATEERFFAEAPRARIIHIAAHAFVDDRHPKFSGIVMSPTAGQGPALEQDGLVQAFEVLEHDLPSDLAVLSACETGLGPLLRGEGLLGLSRAFRLAGVRNLVVSLWKVDDLATAAFMYEFHSRLRGTGTPSAALREAKLAFAAADVAGIPDGSPPGSELRGVARRHRGELRGGPAVWASFVLVGGAVR